MIVSPQNPLSILDKTNKHGVHLISQKKPIEENTNKQSIHLISQKKSIEGTVESSNVEKSTGIENEVANGIEPQMDDDPEQMESTSENNQLLHLEEETEVQNPIIMDAASKTRKNILQEIYNTEKEYVKNIQILLDCYILPLEEENSPLLNDAQIAVFFSNLRQLVTLNSKFLDDLEELMQRYENLDRQSDVVAAESIGEIFCHYAPLFKIYAGYAMCFEGALAKIRLYKQANAYAFAEHLERSQERSKSRQSFEDFLIRPIQRVPQYRLLLKSILNCIPLNHPDRSFIDQAVEKISDAATLINETIRQHEAREAVLATQAQFGGQVYLLTHDRVVVKAGTVLKVSRKGPEPVFLHLFNDLLLYSDVLMSGGFRLRRSIKLTSRSSKVTETLPDTCSSICAENRELDRGNGFMISSSEKSFMLFASSPEERITWVREIRNAIQQSSRSVSVEQSSLDSRDPAALWVPDSLAGHCPICNVVFTMLFRRHHCRRCGCVICGQCSGKRTIFCHPDPFKELRVCDRCDRILNCVQMIAQKWLSLLVVHQGWLRRKRGRKWNKYFFQLKGGILRQYSMAPGRRSGDRVPLDELELAGAIVVRRTDRAKRHPNCFQISSSSIEQLHPTSNNNIREDARCSFDEPMNYNKEENGLRYSDLDWQSLSGLKSNCNSHDGDHGWILCAHSAKEEKEWVDILQHSADEGLQSNTQIKLYQGPEESNHHGLENKGDAEIRDISFKDDNRIERRRHDILQEIVRSESSYVSCLGDCIDVFVKPLFLRIQAGNEYMRRMGGGKSRKGIRIIESGNKRSPVFSPRAALGRWSMIATSPRAMVNYERSPSLPTKPMILDANLAVFFNSIEQIFTLNAHLLDHLTRHLNETADRTNNPLPIHRIGAIFNAYAPLFKLYTVYASRHEAALHAIESPEFQEFLNEMPPGATLHRLTTYLNMPMDRIPRYKVILQELAEWTSEDHIDYQPLKVSIDKVNMAVEFIHEKIADRENWEKVVSIQQAYGGMDKVHLLMKGRRFCKEGFLRKICRKDVKTYHFVLFNNALIYGHVIGINSFKHHRTIDFWNCRLVDLKSTSLILSQAAGETQETMVQNAFEIHSPAKSFVVVAETAEQKKSWWVAIQKCLDAIGESPYTSSKIKNSFDDQIDGLAISCSMEDAAPNLSPDDSMIIKTGWANVLCHRQQKVLRRWLVLTKCRLTFFRTYKTAVPYASLDLSSCVLTSTEAVDGSFMLKAALVPIGPYRDFKFLNGILGIHEYTFQPDSETDALEWKKAIIFCAAGDAQGYLEEARKSPNASPTHAPIFMFDKESRTCTICDASFSLFRRRHHCRRCGNLVCRSCSRNKWVLAHIDQSRLSRICDNCACNVSQEYSEELAFHCMVNDSGSYF